MRETIKTVVEVDPLGKIMADAEVDHLVMKKENGDDAIVEHLLKAHEMKLGNPPKLTMLKKSRIMNGESKC
jgi:hypothetical protein